MLSLLSATMIVIENSLVHCYLYFTAHSTSRADQVVKREICSIITKGKISFFVSVISSKTCYAIVTKSCK